VSFPLKNDPEQAKEFLYGYMEAIMKDEEAAQSWRQLNRTVGIKLNDLDLGFTLQCSSEGLSASHGYPDKPDVGLSLSSDTFHKLFTGKGNPMMEFTLGRIKTEGDMGAVLKIVGALPQNIRVYQQYLAEKGLA